MRDLREIVKDNIAAVECGIIKPGDAVGTHHLVERTNPKTGAKVLVREPVPSAAPHAADEERN